ncbi:MAG: GNAT family N-acetyltransferase [Planctomycetota bacterium]|jgi:RimJ/RimL family protein N-acetyltransferase
MFSRDEVTLRPVDWADKDQMYPWHCDAELEILSGWGPRRSRSTYETKFREFLENPPVDLEVFVIEHRGTLVGRIELAEIDLENRRASMGLFLGDKRTWGTGIGSSAVITMLDYAFTVRNLERIYAQAYSFNERARRLMSSVGFSEEGLLRAHERHNGAAQDMCVFGMLAEEFRERHETLFRLPD